MMSMAINGLLWGGALNLTSHCEVSQPTGVGEGSAKISIVADDILGLSCRPNNDRVTHPAADLRWKAEGYLEVQGANKWLHNRSHDPLIRPEVELVRLYWTSK